MFARSSSDDKGPIMMLLTAFDVLKAAALEPAINVKVLLDSEEEKGSPTIGAVAKAVLQALQLVAPGIVVLPEHRDFSVRIILHNIFGVDTPLALIVWLPTHGPWVIFRIAPFGRA